jgi:aryl-phospho-beta-D-glucosidase BglC (GH1 family)
VAVVIAGAVFLGACGPLAAKPQTAAAPAKLVSSPSVATPAPTTPTTTPSTTAPTTTSPTTTPPTTTAPPASGGGFGPRLAGEPAVGTNVHATWSNMTPAALNTIYAQLQAAGVTWVRIDMGWASFEPAPQQLSAGYVAIADNAVNAAQAHGLKVLADLWSTPGWANGNGATNVPPTNPADYAWIASWAATHFAGRVSAWEIWNEENSATFWNPPNPAAYTALVKLAYPAIKTADPSATVVLGGVSYNDTSYLSALYADGIQGSFDVLATHPYEGVASNPPTTADDGTEYTLAHVAAVHTLMVQHGDANKPIWFTEFGWSDHSNATTPLASNGSTNWEQGVTDAQQGDYLVDTLRWVAQNAPYVTNTFSYEAVNETGQDIQNANYGLLNTDLSPKPAYTILEQYLTQ